MTHNSNPDANDPDAWIGWYNHTSEEEFYSDLYNAIDLAKEAIRLEETDQPYLQIAEEAADLLANALDKHDGYLSYDEEKELKHYINEISCIIGENK